MPANELALCNNAGAAVQLAEHNWAMHTEPADLRILVEAAAATGDREAAHIAPDWIARTGCQLTAAA